MRKIVALYESDEVFDNIFALVMSSNGLEIKPIGTDSIDSAITKAIDLYVPSSNKIVLIVADCGVSSNEQEIKSMVLSKIGEGEIKILACVDSEPLNFTDAEVIDYDGDDNAIIRFDSADTYYVKAPLYGSSEEILSSMFASEDCKFKSRNAAYNSMVRWVSSSLGSERCPIDSDNEIDIPNRKELAKQIADTLFNDYCDEYWNEIEDGE